MPELLERKHYVSDLNDAEWGLIEPLLPPLIDKGWGASSRWHRRDVVDAILYAAERQATCEIDERKTICTGCYAGTTAQRCKPICPAQVLMIGAIIESVNCVMGASPRRITLDSIDEILILPIAADLPAAAGNRLLQRSAYGIVSMGRNKAIVTVSVSHDGAVHADITSSPIADCPWYGLDGHVGGTCNARER